MVRNSYKKFSPKGDLTLSHNTSVTDRQTNNDAKDAIKNSCSASKIVQCNVQ